MIYLLILAWLGLGFLGSGFFYATLRREWPLSEMPVIRASGFALVMTFFGPIGLLISPLEWGYGWLCPFTKGGEK